MQIFFVVGHYVDRPGQYWTVQPYEAHKDRNIAEKIVHDKNTHAFDKDTGFRFKVENLRLID